VNDNSYDPQIFTVGATTVVLYAFVFVQCNAMHIKTLVWLSLAIWRDDLFVHVAGLESELIFFTYFFLYHIIFFRCSWICPGGRNNCAYTIDKVFGFVQLNKCQIHIILQTVDISKQNKQVLVPIVQETKEQYFCAFERGSSTSRKVRGWSIPYRIVHHNFSQWSYITLLTMLTNNYSEQ
jgi:hypothetical protein